MAESLANDPKVLGVFKDALEKYLNVFDTPDLFSFVLSLILNWISYKFWSGIIEHDWLVNLASSMIEAELRMRDFDAVFSKPL